MFNYINAKPNTILKQHFSLGIADISESLPSNFIADLIKLVPSKYKKLHTFDNNSKELIKLWGTIKDEDRRIIVNYLLQHNEIVKRYLNEFYSKSKELEEKMLEIENIFGENPINLIKILPNKKIQDINNYLGIFDNNISIIKLENILEVQNVENIDKSLIICNYFLNKIPIGDREDIVKKINIDKTITINKIEFVKNILNEKKEVIEKEFHKNILENFNINNFLLFLKKKYTFKEDYKSNKYLECNIRYLNKDDMIKDLYSSTFKKELTDFYYERRDVFNINMEKAYYEIAVDIVCNNLFIKYDSAKNNYLIKDFINNEIYEIIFDFYYEKYDNKIELYSSLKASKIENAYNRFTIKIFNENKEELNTINQQNKLNMLEILNILENKNINNIKTIQEIRFEEEKMIEQYKDFLKIAPNFLANRDVQQLRNEIIKLFKEKISQCSFIILEHLNKSLSMSLDFNILNQNRFNNIQPIINLLKENGQLDEMYDNVLSKLIAEHPKDDYINTRKYKRKFIIHCGPTNSGKTYNAIKSLEKAKNGIYLAPLRLLAYEQYYNLNSKGIRTTLLTGEEEILVENATHICSTIEMAPINSKDFDIAIIDESQLLEDSQRGYAWTRAILGLIAKEIHICCSPDAVDIIKKLIEDCNDTVEIRKYERKTPLKVINKPYIFPKDVKKGDALVVFSKKSVLRVSSILNEKGFITSIIYGSLPPETRRLQMDRFLNNNVDVLVTTDAVGMGLNLPIKRIVFLEEDKFDGKKIREINSKEIKQIAGRAGRYGIYDIGEVSTINDYKNIKQKLESTTIDVKNAFIAPEKEAILSLPYGTMKERLKAWQDYNKILPIFNKKDLSSEFQLLDLLNDIEYKYSLDEIYKMITIPFDTNENELVSLWFNYVNTYKYSSIIFPVNKKEGLTDLELYYKELDLYYSFNKTFELTFDISRVIKEKLETSKKINNILINNVVNYKNKCLSCGKELPWNHYYKYCNFCSKYY